MKHEALKLLLVEDSELDATLITEILEESGYEVEPYRVDTADTMKTALDKTLWDIVISDFTMPNFRCLDALQLLKNKSSTTPFILVSGAIGEETAVEVMKAGADDYIMKNNLSRLPEAVKREIAESKVKEKFLELEKRYQKLVELSPDGILIECDGKIVFTNRAGYELFGAKKAAELTGKYFADLIHEDHKSFYLELIKRVKENNMSSKLTEMQFTRLDNEVRDAEIVLAPFLYNTKPAYQLVIRDITERKQAESLAYHDALTGLSNRALLERVLTLEVEEAKRRKNKIAVLFIDLDGFKAINDNYGHAAGDILLKEVATRLQDKVRKADIVARIGGDEFVIATPLAKTEKSIEMFAKRIINVFKKTINIQGKEITITASIGISVYPKDGNEGRALLHNADIAMYRAKNHGKNNFRFYSQDSE